MELLPCSLSNLLYDKIDTSIFQPGANIALNSYDRKQMMEGSTFTQTGSVTASAVLQPSTSATNVSQVQPASNALTFTTGESYSTSAQMSSSEQQVYSSLNKPLLEGGSDDTNDAVLPQDVLKVVKEFKETQKQDSMKPAGSATLDSIVVPHTEERQSGQDDLQLWSSIVRENTVSALPLRTTLRMARDVCSGLEYLHNKDMVVDLTDRRTVTVIVEESEEPSDANGHVAIRLQDPPGFDKLKDKPLHSSGRSEDWLLPEFSRKPSDHDSLSTRSRIVHRGGTSRAFRNHGHSQLCCLLVVLLWGVVDSVYNVVAR